MTAQSNKQERQRGRYTLSTVRLVAPRAPACLTGATVLISGAPLLRSRLAMRHHSPRLSALTTP